MGVDVTIETAVRRDVEDTVWSVYSAVVICFGHDSDCVRDVTLVLGSVPDAMHSLAFVSVTLLSHSRECAGVG